MLLQQTGKFLLDIFKMKMKGKIKKTVTCEWVRIEPVEGENCLAETEEEFGKMDNLIGCFQFKTNLLLQRTGWALSEKLTTEGTSPVDAWNDS